MLKYVLSDFHITIVQLIHKKKPVLQKLVLGEYIFFNDIQCHYIVKYFIVV